MVRKTKLKKLLWCAFILYSTAMLWLLFGRSQFDIGRDYWEQVKMNLNLVPFNTIWQYLYLMVRQTNPYLLHHAFINLFGNVAAFVPLGFFLPCLWKSAQALGHFLLCTFAVIAAVELIQLFTLLGSCDIDDLILNVIGTSIGFTAFRFIQKKILLKQDTPKC